MLSVNLRPAARRVGRFLGAYIVVCVLFSIRVPVTVKGVALDRTDAAPRPYSNSTSEYAVTVLRREAHSNENAAGGTQAAPANSPKAINFDGLGEISAAPGSTPQRAAAPPMPAVRLNPGEYEEAAPAPTAPPMTDDSKQGPPPGVTLGPPVTSEDNFGFRPAKAAQAAPAQTADDDLGFRPAAPPTEGPWSDYQRSAPPPPPGYGTVTIVGQAAPMPPVETISFDAGRYLARLGTIFVCLGTLWFGVIPNYSWLRCLAPLVPLFAYAVGAIWRLLYVPCVWSPRVHDPPFKGHWSFLDGQGVITGTIPLWRVTTESILYRLLFFEEFVFLIIVVAFYAVAFAIVKYQRPARYPGSLDR